MHPNDQIGSFPSPFATLKHCDPFCFGPQFSTAVAGADASKAANTIIAAEIVTSVLAEINPDCTLSEKSVMFGRCELVFAHFRGENGAQVRDASYRKSNSYAVAAPKRGTSEGAEATRHQCGSRR